MKTNTKEFNAKVYPYILNAIDSTNYGIEKKTDIEKLQFVADTFKSEYLNEYNLRRYGSIQNVLANWFTGLPSSINIDFENYRIIEIAKEWGWGSLPENSTDAQENKILENWFNLIAFKTIQLMGKNGIHIKN